MYNHLSWPSHRNLLCRQKFPVFLIMVAALSYSSFVRGASSSLAVDDRTFTVGASFGVSGSVRFRSTIVSSACASAGRVKSSSPPPHLCSRMNSSASLSLYEVLGIPMGATSDEIKVAYRRLARVCHPDVVSMNLKDKSGDEFMRIHAAYSTLSDPEKRAEYDLKLFNSRRSSLSSFPTSASAFRSSTTVPAEFSGYTRRRWETDQCW